MYHYVQVPLRKTIYKRVLCLRGGNFWAFGSVVPRPLFNHVKRKIVCHGDSLLLLFLIWLVGLAEVVITCKVRRCKFVMLLGDSHRWFADEVGLSWANLSSNVVINDDVLQLWNKSSKFLSWILNFQPLPAKATGNERRSRRKSMEKIWLGLEISYWVLLL